MRTESPAQGPGHNEDHDQSRSPEEDSPERPGHLEGALLLVQILGADLRPRGALDYTLSGPGLSFQGRTDEDGVLEVDGCISSSYELVIEGQRRIVHALCPADLGQDPAPYRVIVAASYS